MFLDVVHYTQLCSDTEVLSLPISPSNPLWMCSTAVEGMEYQREHLLAGIWHLATHSPEVLEAIPDGMDVGHSHKHNLTVRIVFCRQERKGEHTNMSQKQPLRTRTTPVDKRAFPWQNRTLQDSNSDSKSPFHLWILKSHYSSSYCNVHGSSTRDNNRNAQQMVAALTTIF